MNLQERINRSKSIERIQFDKIGCKSIDEPLVALKKIEQLLIQPIWEIADSDHEGSVYAAYRLKCPWYSHIYIRKTLVSMLKTASQALPTHLKLVVRAAHRPLEVQVKVLHDLKSFYLVENPGMSEDEALQKARLFVSDPAIHLPPHCCGAAVDVDVFDSQSKKYVDFGAPINTDSEISYLHTDLITEVQKNNRITLLTAMLSAGFASDAFEWWHYSYGDQVWAWFYRKDDSLYNLIEPQL